jgi:hypothetical protein
MSEWRMMGQIRHSPFADSLMGYTCWGAPDIVKRPRLISHLNVRLRYTLTLVSARVGFGKTTALAEWLDQLQRPAVMPGVEKGIVAQLRAHDGVEFAELNYRNRAWR